MNVKAFAAGFALVLPLTVVGVADAAPKAPTSSLVYVSGTQFGDDVGFAWSFSGKPGQYPRLHIEMLCWYDPQAAESIDFDARFAYGSTVYLDGASVPVPLYPGSGVAYFRTGSGVAPWTYEPAPAYYCRGRLLDWGTQGIRNQFARFWETTPVFVLTDPRVAS